MEIIDSFSDSLDYYVTTDLKKYVERKYKGRFVEDEEYGCGGESTQMAAVGNKDILLRESMAQNDQVNTTEVNTSTKRNTIVPEEDGYGTFIPYRDRMVEPKEEDPADGAITEVDKLVASMKEGGQIGEQLANECDTNSPERVAQLEDVANIEIVTDNDGIELHTDDIDVPYLDNVVDMERDVTEDGSSTRRSGRKTKRPKHLTESDEEDDGPVPIKVTRAQPKKTNEDESVSTGIQCQKCLKQFNVQYRSFSKAKEHAIIHTELQRYECPVKRCGYKSGPCTNVLIHMKHTHKVNNLKQKEIPLTTEQEEELDKVTKECFPEFGVVDRYKNCKICQVAIWTSSLNQHHARHHSLTHIKFMLYKCNQQNCRYTAKYYRFMKWHGRNKHGIEDISKEDTAIELTDDQKKEMEDMLKRCFPDVDVEE